MLKLQHLRGHRKSLYDAGAFHLAHARSFCAAEHSLPVHDEINIFATPSTIATRFYASLRDCRHLPLASGPPWRYTVMKDRALRSHERGRMETLTVPQLAIPTASAAMALVNRWLHREVGMAVHTTVAHFDATTFCWHLPIELAYATHGTLGVVGDVYLHAATGTFVGRPSAEELIRRAEGLAAACGIDGC